MAEHGGPVAKGRKILHFLRRAPVAEDQQLSSPTTHRVLIEHGDESPPSVFTVDITPTARGASLVTCRELPELMVRGANEASALVRAELAIEEALLARRGSAGFPS